MKIVHLALIAATIAVGGVAPAMADQDPVSMWVLTRDAAYARMSGLTDKQIDEAAHMRYESVSLQ